MPVHYIDFNNKLIPENEAVLTTENRAFRYGDGLFETMRWMDGDIRFLHHHLNRLHEGMRMLHLDRVSDFNEQFVRDRAAALIRKNGLEGQHARVRLQVYRDGGGLYSPQQNRAAYVMSVTKLDPDDVKHRKIGLIVDVYTEYRKPYSELSKLKSANALLYVMAGLYRKQKGLDDVVILNRDGYICESLSSNIFFWYGKKLYTPAISEGCIDGVMRKVVIEIALDSGLDVIEAQISPDIMQEADEIFHTNAIHGVQWVMGYKQKRYFNRISRMLQERLAAVNC
ncbi:branched-chain amino acid aminotransferase [Parapedobacter composti]|uniref:branched-chain-amino-acid transaminase n=1 Tax=Parapedobacter composti TaxID=623281 RepID=A0A1I1GES1_9SPHI|nr:aminotransferase class IV [Parapedobacter composti]SFC10061.1 branched-chain amino acid aminotransferase [Parapedobacter composti]